MAEVFGLIQMARAPIRFPLTPDRWRGLLQESAEAEHGPTALVLPAEHFGAIAEQRRRLPKAARRFGELGIRKDAQGRFLELPERSWKWAVSAPAHVGLKADLLDFCKRRLSAMPRIEWIPGATPELPFLPAAFHSEGHGLLIFANRTDKRAFIAFRTGKPIPKKRGRKPKLTPQGHEKRERRKERRKRYLSKLKGE
jgi:hypothetical protein